MISIDQKGGFFSGQFLPSKLGELYLLVKWGSIIMVFLVQYDLLFQCLPVKI